MKKFALLSAICLCCSTLFAQKKPNTDSLAYEAQRAKINAMLDQRREKFGQYSESLKKHTGIFGLQTKKDIRRSNDILLDINKTDEDIFEQTKILLNFRTDQLNSRVFQQQQVQVKSEQLEDHSVHYMATINQLREQVDKLKKDADEAERHYDHKQVLNVIVFLLMVASILILLFRKRAARV